jgi:hypothetical protein
MCRRATFTAADTRRSMTKTTTIIAMIGGLTLGTALSADAQTTPAATPYHFSISAGGQFNSHEFSPVSTFTLFNETGTVTANQTVGGGFVFDASGGYRVWRNVSVAVGISTFSGNGEAAAIAAIPDPTFVGRPTLKTFEASDFGELSQSHVAVNFQVVWMRPLTEKIDLMAFGGPSIIHVSMDVPSVTPDTNALPTTISDSKSTGKAGTVGVDLSYRLNPRYSAGAFIRYLGGQVDLPSAENLTVGGLQLAAGIRVRL